MRFQGRRRDLFFDSKHQQLIGAARLLWWPTGEDQFVVYVYDTDEFPFFLGERSHQFHRNTVVRRDVPESYTEDLANTLAAAGELDSPCDGR